MVAQQNLNRSQSQAALAMERLSSGLRINGAKDGAAELSISNRMTAQINGMAQAQRNANDGISVAQTAESAMGQINDNLLRIRDLAQQAASDTNSETDRESIQEEITARVEEIDRIASATEFNDIKLLDGSKTELNIQIGAKTSDADSIEIKLTDVSASAIILDSEDDPLDLKSGAVDDFEAAQNTIDAIDNAIAKVDTARSGLGSIQNRFESVITNLQDSEINLSAARSRIIDADYATTVAELTKAQITQQAGASILAQANAQPNMVLSLLT